MIISFDNFVGGYSLVRFFNLCDQIHYFVNIQIFSLLLALAKKQ